MSMKMKRMPAEIPPVAVGCTRCAQLEAVREDFKRAQDHYAARAEQSRDALDAQQKKLDGARDYARGMLKSEDGAVRSAGIIFLGLLQP